MMRQFFLLTNETKKTDPNDPWHPSIFTLKDAFTPRQPADYVVKISFQTQVLQSFMALQEP